ncbi:MAG: hypothetical protein OXB95_04660 [Rhodobacteraceae bacterium]|nr:hypothetical protein [Paracoccaceae bacterium]
MDVNRRISKKAIAGNCISKVAEGLDFVVSPNIGKVVQKHTPDYRMTTKC